MAEAELFEIARSYDSLSLDAQTALRAEFTHRNLEPPLVDELEPIESDQFQGRLSRGRAGVSVFFSLPFPLGKQTWSCDACGAAWEEADDNSADRGRAE